MWRREFNCRFCTPPPQWGRIRNAIRGGQNIEQQSANSGGICVAAAAHRSLHPSILLLLFAMGLSPSPLPSFSLSFKSGDTLREDEEPLLCFCCCYLASLLTFSNIFAQCADPLRNQTEARRQQLPSIRTTNQTRREEKSPIDG